LLREVFKALRAYPKFENEKQLQIEYQILKPGIYSPVFSCFYGKRKKDGDLPKNRVRFFFFPAKRCLHLVRRALRGTRSEQGAV